MDFEQTSSGLPVEDNAVQGWMLGNKLLDGVGDDVGNVAVQASGARARSDDTPQGKWFCTMKGRSTPSVCKRRVCPPTTSMWMGWCTNFLGWRGLVKPAKDTLDKTAVWLKQVWSAEASD